MAHFWADNVHSTAFTPRDYQVEVLAAAYEGNIISCLSHHSSKEFIALKLLQEFAHEVRNKNMISLYITIESTGESAQNLIQYLTDLNVYNITLNPTSCLDKAIYTSNDIVITTPALCLDALANNAFDMQMVNIIIIEDCHMESNYNHLIKLFTEFYSTTKRKPKVFGLGGPLYGAGCAPSQLYGQLRILEKGLCCKLETASDIVTLLRYCSKPSEIILQCSPPSSSECTAFLENLVQTRKAFLKDHRFDPSEIYSDEFSEELEGIPDPKKDPLECLDIYLEILNDMGPWCADKAAHNLLLQIEKQKVKTPYERHYLLLCLIFTMFVEVRAYCDYLFQPLSSEKEKNRKIF